MSNEPILPKSCYICLEECNTTSPCECKAPVHRKCLMTFNIKSKKSNCTICQGNFQQPLIVKWVLTALTGIFIIISSVVFYLCCGFIGEFLRSNIGICDCENLSDTFFNIIQSRCFAESSIPLMIIFWVCVGCLKIRSCCDAGYCILGG